MCEPTFPQLTQLAHTIAHRVGRLLERAGLPERDTEQLDLGPELGDDDPMPDLLCQFNTNRPDWPAAPATMGVRSRA